MVDTSALESYLNDNSCKDGDVVEILNEGVIEGKVDPKDGRKYFVLNVGVRCGLLELVYSPNKDAQEVLKEAFGRDTKSWVGKKFVVKIYPKTSFGVTKNAILPVIIDLKA